MGLYWVVLGLTGIMGILLGAVITFLIVFRILARGPSRMPPELAMAMMQGRKAEEEEG